MTNIALTIKYFDNKDIYPILLEKIKKLIQSLLKTINFDYINEENKNIHIPNSPQTFYHPYKMLLIGDVGSGKTNALLNSSRPFIKLIKSHHSDIHCTKNEVLH